MLTTPKALWFLPFGGGDTFQVSKARVTQEARSGLISQGLEEQHILSNLHFWAKT